MTQQFPITAMGDHRLIHRSAIVRLGPQMAIHTDTNHASLGVTSIEAVDDHLEVRTDFAPGELILSATANVDATLAAKGVFVGASGGSGVTRFAIYSSKSLPYGTSSTKPAYTLLNPKSSVFNSTIDNLWIHFLSIRSTES